MCKGDIERGKEREGESVCESKRNRDEKESDNEREILFVGERVRVDGCGVERRVGERVCESE